MLDAARDAVMAAINGAPASGPPEPDAASGASGYLNVHDLPGISDGMPPSAPQAPDLTEAAANGTASLPAVEPLPLVQPPAGPGSTAPTVVSPDAPPPVPPPLPLDDLSKFTTPGQ
jgi:hypothetical protein